MTSPAEHPTAPDRGNSSTADADSAQPEVEVTSDGTEAEDIGITKPFDPTLIDIATKQMSMDTLIRRLREREVDLSPDFQRGEVWKPTAKSRLIESLLIRIPLPAFYMDATDEDRWLVVDGLQRLSTIRDFVIDGSMRLSHLEFLVDFHGFSFDDLPRNYQRRIEETQVTVYLIEKGTPSDVKFNIFKRINTGGLPLSAQEIRHALNIGPVTTFLKNLVALPEFQDSSAKSVSDKRMAARECALRFIAFTLTPPHEYKAADFDAFLSDAMATLNAKSDAARADLEGRFRRALTASDEIFGDAAFRKPGRKNKSPVNKALFEVWTVSMDRLSDQQIAQLYRARGSVVQEIDDFMREDSEFMNAISQGTGDLQRIRFRFSRFLEVLEDMAE